MRERYRPEGRGAKQRADAATLADALENFLVGNRTLREKSRADYRLLVGRYLAPWLDVPLLPLITREMVEARHSAYRSRNRQWWPVSGQATANATMRVLRAIWNFAEDKQPDLGRNPVRLKKAWFDIPLARTAC